MPVNYFNLGEIYGNVANVQNARLQNRISAMQLAETEKKIAKESRRNELASMYTTPAQPGGISVNQPGGQDAFSAYKRTSAPPLMDNVRVAGDTTFVNQGPTRTGTPTDFGYQPGSPASFNMGGYLNQASAEGIVDPIEAAKYTQANEDKLYQSKMDFYTPVMKTFIEKGDGEGLKKLVTGMKQDPVLAKRMPPELDLNLTPAGELETTIKVTPQTVDPRTNQPFLDPVTKQPITEGIYKFVTKNGQLMKIEPVKQDVFGYGKQVERTVDLGDKVEYIYTDGTKETKPKGMTPGADIQDRRLKLLEEKEAKKEETEVKKEDLKMKGAMAKADILIGKVDEALSKTGFWTTGLTGDLRSTMVGRVTGGGAFDLEKTIDTIKSIIGFEELQAMRDASKTGGALGQVAVRELELLQSTIAGLDKGQSEAQLRQNLEQVKTHYQNIKAALAKIAEAELQPTGQPQTKAPTGKRPPLSAFEKR